MILSWYIRGQQIKVIFNLGIWLGGWNGGLFCNMVNISKFQWEPLCSRNWAFKVWFSRVWWEDVYWCLKMTTSEYTESTVIIQRILEEIFKQIWNVPWKHHWRVSIFSVPIISVIYTFQRSSVKKQNEQISWAKNIHHSASYKEEEMFISAFYCTQNQRLKISCSKESKLSSKVNKIDKDANCNI